MPSLLLASILLLDSTCPSQQALLNAQRLFDRGDYAGAAVLYDRLAAQGVNNGTFYLNQGNAHFMAGHLPEAILAYHRAERFMPSHPELRANFAEARRRVIDPPTLPEEATGWLPTAPRATQIRLALAGYVAAWGLFLVWLWRPARWLLCSAILILGGSIVLGCLCYQGDRGDQEQPFAVVTQDNVVLRQGNGLTYAPVVHQGLPVTLHRGTELRVQCQRSNGWLQVELLNGLLGWLPRETLLLDRDTAPLA
jgi:hypothetical protein